MRCSFYAESSSRVDTHHEDGDIQLHFKLLCRKTNFKKSDRNIWTLYAEWYTSLTVNLFEMSSLSFAKRQWQQCQFIKGLLISPSFNTELNQPTGQMLKHNHHSGCDSPPQTFPTFYLWHLLGWPCHLFQEPMLLLCEKEGMPVGGSGHGLQSALVMIAIEDKTSLDKWHGAAWTDPSSTSTISQTVPTTQG